VPSRPSPPPDAGARRRPPRARTLGPTTIIDADTHLIETRSLWADHLDAAHRHLAMRIEDDDAGWSWLTTPDGRRIHLAEAHTPGDIVAMGARRDRQRRGLPPHARFDDELPPDDRDPGARLAKMGAHGIDEAVVFPNFGLFWVRSLEPDPGAQLANMQAWNRWAVEGIAPAGQGRLHPVGHVSLRDAEWLERALDDLAAGGVTAAMVPIGPVDGKAFSHADLDRCWSAFEDHGVAAVFHIHDAPRPFDDAWYAADANPIEPMLMSTFISVTPMLALTDMSVGGVFARHPRLRVGLVEFTSAWLVPFLRMVDVTYRFHGDYNGLRADRLPLAPSEYLRRQVRAATFGFEHPATLQDQLGDMLMFGSDWPHAEGLARPLDDFTAAGGPAPGPAADGLYRGNVSWLLGA
jgi:predicted TIM-barrel fold metal-dependent hydrolase